jgi:hypothetical protein
MATPSINFDAYTPAVADIPEARVMAVRTRLETWLKQGWPDLDTRPNSVYGDLALTPLAYQVAAAEIAAERVISDLDLEQVANNVIWNCDVVRQFLRNFAAVERDNLKATGTLRLTFSTNVSRTIDRSTLYLFGTENIFTLRLPGTGHLSILTVGSVPSQVNDVVLSRLDANTYIVDVPIMGVMPSTVSAGDTATTDNLITGLIGMTALNDFDPGTPVETLSVLAARTRETVYSSSLTTRGGAGAFVRKEFPAITNVSATISGDDEMLRDTVNALGIRDGRVDVQVKSKQAYLTSTQLVRLYLNVGADKFVGRMSLASLPVKLDAIIPAAVPAQAIAPVIYSRSLDPARAPLATAAYSALEDLWLVIPMPRGVDTLPLIPVSVDSNGSYADFNITYRYDPGLTQVSSVLNSTEVKPVGVDVLTKAFVPCIFSSLLVQYVKPAGRQVNLAQARTEILAYFRGLTYPDIYVDSAISDALLYAGASGVKSVTCNAAIQWSVASKFLPASAPLPSANLSAAIAAAITPPARTIHVTAELVPSYQDVNLGTASATMVAAGKRNINYVLDDSALIFTEYTP